MKIAIIGGGIAGASSAIYLRSLGLSVTLFEKKPFLVSGPPACHLHAGGNLYPDIDDEQRKRLLQESITFLRHYPQAIEKRPTLLAVPKHIELDAQELEKRAELLAKYYKELIEQDSANQVLGDPQHYSLAFSKSQIKRLQSLPTPKVPQNHIEWLIAFSKEVDLERLKFPVLLIQEYGINIFRLSALAHLYLQDAPIYFNTKVVDVKQQDNQFFITFKKEGKIRVRKFDFLINAAGFESGTIDDMLGFKINRLVEFKAAYVAQYKSEHLYPEIIFHGIRGTDRGMAQFTPYSGGYYQLHGMRKDITLFEDGIASSTPTSSQPQLAKKYLEWIENGWPKDVVLHRTNHAIEYLSRYLHDFKNAKPIITPLFGAQQIPGDDLSLRAAEVSFEGENYARCEIVKVSSIFAMLEQIGTRLAKLGVVSQRKLKKQRFFSKQVDEKQIEHLACTIAKARGYPKQMAKLSLAYLVQDRPS